MARSSAAPMRKEGGTISTLDPDQGEVQLRPGPEIWTEPAMRRALAGVDIGAVYRILQKHGFSQQRIAALTGQSQPEVSAILHGRQVIAYPVLARVAGRLGIPPSYLGLVCLDCSHITAPATAAGPGEGSTAADTDDPSGAAQVVAMNADPPPASEWVVVAVTGTQVRMFGRVNGGGFRSHAAANRALHRMRRKRTDLDFVVVPLATVPAVSLDSGPCPSCGSLIALEDGLCHAVHRDSSAVHRPDLPPRGCA